MPDPVLKPSPVAPARVPLPRHAPEPVIRVQQPVLPEPAAIMRYYQASVDAGFYANGGPNARELSRRLEEYLGNSAFCIPIANCTVGLMAALRALLRRARRHAPRLVA